MATNFTPLVIAISVAGVALVGAKVYKEVATTANPVTSVLNELEPYSGAINQLAPGLSNALTGAGGALQGAGGALEGAGGLLDKTGSGLGNTLTSIGTGVTDLTSSVGSLLSSPADMGKMLYTGIGNLFSGNTANAKARREKQAKEQEYNLLAKSKKADSINACWNANRSKMNWFQLVFKCGVA